MAQEDEEDRSRLINYVKPLLNRTIKTVNAPISQQANLKMDSHRLSLLPSFHGLSLEDPYKHMEEFIHVMEFLYFGITPLEVVRMRLFPFTLKDKAT